MVIVVVFVGSAAATVVWLCTLMFVFKIVNNLKCGMMMMYKIRTEKNTIKQKQISINFFCK